MKAQMHGVGSNPVVIGGVNACFKLAEETKSGIGRAFLVAECVGQRGFK